MYPGKITRTLGVTGRHILHGDQGNHVLGRDSSEDLSISLARNYTIISNAEMSKFAITVQGTFNDGATDQILILRFNMYY